MYVTAAQPLLVAAGECPDVDQRIASAPFGLVPPGEPIVDDDPTTKTTMASGRCVHRPWQQDGIAEVICLIGAHDTSCILDVPMPRRTADLRKTHTTWFIVPSADTPIYRLMKIFITHCSATKNDEFKGTEIPVPPDRLYTATPTIRFMERCTTAGVPWAILSDQYGVWFPSETHQWYEKSPDAVTDEEFRRLVDDFDTRLKDYDEILFYHNPGRFHPLYRNVIDRSSLTDRVTMISHLAEIV